MVRTYSYSCVHNNCVQFKLVWCGCTEVRPRSRHMGMCILHCKLRLMANVMPYTIITHALRIYLYNCRFCYNTRTALAVH